MRGWFVLAVLAATPLVALADPSRSGGSAPPPAAAAQDNRFAPLYQAFPPRPLFDAPDVGLGVRLTRGGEPVSLSDLSAGRGRGRPLEMEAGYLWKTGGSEAVLGYSQFDLGPRAPSRWSGGVGVARPTGGAAPGVLGFGFRVQTR